MNEVIVVADSAAEAMSRIRRELGPAAVVVSVRQLPQSILTKLWKKPRIEVVAHVPSHPPARSSGMHGRLEELLEAIRLLNRQLPSLESELESAQGGSCHPLAGEGSLGNYQGEPESSETESDEEILAEALERWGLTLSNALTLMECMASLGWEGGSLEEDWRQAREVLLSWWGRPVLSAPAVARRHVFIGGPGSGKTTVLSKWLAQSVLLGEESARVWRLDGCRPNMAQGLSLQAEMLGVPVESAWSGQGKAGEMEFVDLPGTDWRDREAMDRLAVRLEELGGAEVHLVLNAAYDRLLLLEQLEAFGRFGPADLIFTHMDEETCWGKLWNCVMGTGPMIRFLGFGQDVPGALKRATAEELLPQRLG